MPASIELSFVSQLKLRLLEKKPLIQVLLGPRQVGKTTGVLQCLEQLKLPHHYASADDQLNVASTWIAEQWQEAVLLGTESILVIDEIQKIPDWSETIKKLWDRQARERKTQLKVVLLGSSSLQIQKGLTESLTGRFELIRIYHWNFTESAALAHLSLEDYLQYGGYPGSYAHLNEPKRFNEYLKNSIIETVIGKDILMFAQVRSPALFRQAFEIVMGYPAQEISYNKLLGQLQEKGNIDLIKHYIEMYEGAFLLRRLHKYSNKPVLTKSSSPKILPLCPALVSELAPKHEKAYQGRLLELAVGGELNRLPGMLSYWREGNYEVDYIYQEGKKVFAIEVKSGRKKSSAGMEMFLKKYPKAISVFVTAENFLLFSKNAQEFLDKL